MKSKKVYVRAEEFCGKVVLEFHKRKYITEFMEVIESVHDLLMTDSDYAKDNDQELMNAKELWAAARPDVNDFHSWTYRQLMGHVSWQWILNPKMDKRVYDELEYHLKHCADCYHCEAAAREGKGLNAAAAKRKATELENIGLAIWTEIAATVDAVKPAARK